MENYELYHHGVKGMKWGVRKDRIKSAGGRAIKKVKNAASSFNAKRKARRERDRELEEEKRLTKTSVKKLTAEELQKRAAILQARRQALDLEKQCKQANESNMSAGKAFIKKMVTDAAIPAAINSTKTVLGEYFVKLGKERMGLNPQEASDGLRELRRQAEESNLRRQISDNERTINNNSRTDNSLDDLRRQAEEAGYRETIARSNRTQAQAEQARINADRAAQDFARSRENNHAPNDSDGSTSPTVAAGEAYVHQLSQDQTDRLRRLLNR